MANKFVIDSLEYTSADNGQFVFRDEKTIGYCFINTGNCPVFVNNFLLRPNSTFKTFETGYSDQTRWQINFKTTNVPYPACSTENALLIVLIYSER